MTQNQLAPAGSPRIEPQSVDEGQDLTYVATFEVFPEVALQPIESLEIERVTAEVTESDVDAMIERLRKQQMKYTAVTRAGGERRQGHGRFRGLDRRRAVRRRQGRERAPSCSARAACCAQLEQGLIGAAAGETPRDRRGFSGRLPRDASLPASTRCSRST